MNPTGRMIVAGKPDLASSASSVFLGAKQRAKLQVGTQRGRIHEMPDPGFDGRSKRGLTPGELARGAEPRGQLGGHESGLVEEHAVDALKRDRK